MKVLYLGDIMGKPGRDVVKLFLPDLKKEHKTDLVIAQAENVTHGKGMSPAHMRELQDYGVDFFTGGNHTPSLETLYSKLDDPNQPVLAPANMNTHKSEWGRKIFRTKKGDVLIVSLLGSTVPEPLDASNPLHAIDDILKEYEEYQLVAKVVNFHGDYSSEKRVIGYYLDGRVSAVVGDHWHVPTADAMVLPKGTAHITDVGMCGTIHSSLGVKTDVIMRRWKDDEINKNELEQNGPMQLNAVLVEVDENTGLAKSIKQIQKTIS